MRTLVVLIVALGLGCGSEPREPHDLPDAGCPPERCDGKDNDCDGLVDEDFELGKPCFVGAGACRADGVTVCRADGETTTCSARPGSPVAERCNGLDDDCDGEVDEDFGVGASCAVGVGACRSVGVTTCDGPDGTRCDAAPVTPSPERCNGIDDDCNGTVDDVAGLGDGCVADAPGVCAQGHLVCGASELVCAPGAPRQEICDGLDDDCDGVVDEADPRLGLSCSTGEPGVCSAGTLVCAGDDQLICQRTSPPSLERCNGLDDDCNGVVDDACVPPLPRARFPWDGFQTGSPWVPEGVAATPLRPRFQWEPVQGAERYELEVDDSCLSGSFRDCGFPSPEIRVTVTGTSFQPVAPLSVALTPPVGRRYFWRVRGCLGAQCSAFTEVRYLDVGRVPGDVNGDGFADLLVTWQGNGPAGAILLYPGGPMGVPTSPAATIAPPPGSQNQFLRVRGVGDLNADGFADVCVPFDGDPGRAGATYVYYGGPGGLPDQPSRVLMNPVAGLPAFGAACFGAGDVDGDGDADLIVGAIGSDAAFLYLGDPAGLGVTPSLQLIDPEGRSPDFRLFGSSGAGLGDIDGDGYPDFAIGAEFEPLDALFAGAVFVYRGGPFGPSSTPLQVITNSVDPTRVLFGFVIEGNQDIDGDGLADAVIGPDTGLGTVTPFPNAIYVYHGSINGLIDPPFETIRSPRPTNDSFALAVALGDVNGDGRVDLLDGDPFFGALSATEFSGIADLFLGSGGRLGPSPAQTMPNPVAPRDAAFGDQLAVCDLDADGFDERIVTAPEQTVFAARDGAVYFYPGSPAPTDTPGQQLTGPTHPVDAFFGTGLSCGR